MDITEYFNVAREKGYTFSNKVGGIEDKTKRILEDKRIRLVSPLDSRNIHFHVCPVIEDDEKRGFEITYLRQVDEWICTCRHEVYRVKREELCSHILASMYFWSELTK
jgi:hypothetical protein